MVQGVAELKKRFARVIAGAERDALAAIERGMTRVAADTERLAPEDDGDLKASARVEPFDRIFKGYPYKGFGVRYGGLESTKVALKGGTATIDNAALQEFGTQEMTANPALFPAYRAQRKSIRAAVARAVRLALKNG